MVSFFYIFMFIWTPLRTITQRTFAPEDFRPGGIFGQEIFPQEAFVQERPSLPRRLFVQEDVCPFGTIVQRHFCNKGHPSGKSMWFGADCWQPEIRHFGDYSREILTCKLRAATGIFLLLRTCLCFSEARQSHVQLRTKGILCCSILLDWPIKRPQGNLFLLLLSVS